MNPVKKSSDDERAGPGQGWRSTASLVACLSVRPGAGGMGPVRGVGGAGWLLVRADRTGELSPSWLRASHPWRLIYALRSRAHGGDADPAEPGRAARLCRAAATHDL